MVGTVVNFCTNEFRFLRDCLEQALLFSDEVVAVAASHFFDGTLENRELLEKIYTAFPQVQFVEYPFLPAAIPNWIFHEVNLENFWHCLSRWIGFSKLSSRVKWVLFLDADEVADGKRFSAWMKRGEFTEEKVLKLANYWYFREPIYRAKSFEDSVLFVSKDQVTADLILHSHERDALYDLSRKKKKRGVVGLDGAPMFHHFSWVRTEEEMLRKVKSWGHKKDRNWEELVQEEFSSPFKGVDFVHGYEFQTVTTPFALDGSLPLPSYQKRNIQRLSEEEMVFFAMQKPFPSEKRGFWRKMGRLLKERWLSG